ncbi:hypothetical protein B0H14DRAFT_1140198 [Mycena olivaceomarginata]|nr:hypothetical protein B0H14DRAFT_1140198 [Mycena olivaceomarginata]
MRIISALIVAVACASEAWSLVPPFQRTNVFGRGGGTVHSTVPSNSINVQLEDFTLNGTAFSGHIYIKNIAFQKVVTVFYSSATDSFPSNATDQSVAASFSAPITGTNFETWVFAGTIGPAGIRHFYLQYEVSGQTFYDNNGKQNYDVLATTTNTSSPPPSVSGSSSKSISNTNAASGNAFHGGAVLTVLVSALAGAMISP